MMECSILALVSTSAACPLVGHGICYHCGKAAVNDAMVLSLIESEYFSLASDDLVPHSFILLTTLYLGYSTPY